MTGFWELAPVVHSNEKILQMLNTTWFNPSPLPDLWWQAEPFTLVGQQLTQVLQQNFAKSPLWGLKDPRLCRLLPFWIPLLESLTKQLQFILITRHPQEVTASLKQRDNLPYPTALQLWLRYVLEAEYFTRNYPRVWVTYDELLHDWSSTVNKITNALQITWPKLEAKAAIDGFLSQQLKHNHAFPFVASAKDPLTQWSDTVYQELQTHPSLDLFDTIRRALDNYSSYVSATTFPQWSLQRHAQRWPALPLLTKPAPSFHLFLINSDTGADLAATLTSLQAQTYLRWQVTIITTSEITRPPDEAQVTCQLVTVADIQVTIQQLIVHSSADWLGLLAAGDRLAPDLLLKCADYLTQHPHWQFLYVDEETPCGPLFKPDFNLDLLRSTPYIGNFALVLRTAFPKLINFISVALANHELALHLLDKEGEAAIGHLPHILFYQAAISIDDDYVITLLYQHLRRRNLQAEIYETDFPHIFYVEYALLTYPRISILIATCHPDSKLSRCLASLTQLTTYPHYEIIIVVAATEVVDCTSEVNVTNSTKPWRVLRYTGEPKLAKMYNFAVAHATGEVLLLLNEDTEIIQPDWLEALVRQQQRTEVGVVGARLLDSHQHIWQAGLILGLGRVGIAGQVHRGLSHDELGYLGRLQTVQNFSAVTEDCMMLAKSLYLNVGGMNEALTFFNEIEFCLHVTQRGFKIVWTPFATVLQHGPGSFVNYRALTQLAEEVTQMYQRLLPQLSQDPAYHPKLSLTEAAWQPEIQLAVPWDNHRHERPRVVAFPFDSWGCGEYRVRAPLRALQAAGYLDYVLLPDEQVGRIPTPPELARMQPDILLLHNTLHDAHLEALPYYRQPFKILSQDDLLYALPPQHPAKSNSYQDSQGRIRFALTHCDRLLVSTEPLAEAYQYLAADLKIVPNYLERARWENLTTLQNFGKKPRIGWAGAAQHEGDLQLLIPVFEQLSKEVEFVLFGLCPAALRPYVHEYHPMVNFDHYPAKLASLHLDVAIAPLVINSFNEAKSNLRILEYGIFGWPVVCSDIYPYQSAPVTRVANTPQAWLAALREHINDLPAATKAGENLQKWVRQHWLLEDHLEQWSEALQVRLRKPVSRLNYLQNNFGLTSRLPANQSQLAKKRWIFLLGVDDASTRLLEQLLSCHPDITSLSDSHESAKFFDETLRFPASLTQQPLLVSQLWTEDASRFRYRPQEKGHQAKLLQRGWLQSLEKPEAMWVVQRSATHFAKALWLQEHFPESYFIQVKRSVDGVALELVESIRQQHPSQPKLWYRAARHWVRSLEIFQEELWQLQRFLEVDYSDLAQSMAKVFKFLGLVGVASEDLKIVERPLTAEQRAIIQQAVGKLAAVL